VEQKSKLIFKCNFKALLVILFVFLSIVVGDMSKWLVIPRFKRSLLHLYMQALIA